ncbi:MAG: hypothetical protein PUE27_00365 [Sharpea porci]|uniref:hypothetical protein n=1 Tax=Sharpea porci TaxID=2652286 RepID=UPI00240930E8|nr:hypothetical protein [Sharpea porci]MDD6710534.1 hypothetical protein [Sharpea porci]
MRRIINLIIVASIVLSYIVFPSVSQAYDESNYQQLAESRYNVLSSLKIYEGNYSVSSGITRIDVVKSLIKIVDKVSYAYAYDGYDFNITDIGEADKKDIEVAIKKGFIRIPSDGKFYPDAYADYDFVSYALVAMTGYIFDLDNNQYKSHAASLGLSDNLRPDSGNNFSAADFVIMLDNFLNSKYIVVDYQHNVSYTTSSDTVLEGMFGIRKAEWRLVANSYTDLNGTNTVANNNLVFRDKYNYLYTNLQCDYDYDETLMGRQLEVYYDIEDEKILYMQPKRLNDCIIEIIGNSIVDFDYKTRKLSYNVLTSGDRWNQKFDIKTKKVPAEMDIIFNGQFTLEHDYVYRVLNGEEDLNISRVYLYDIDGDSDPDMMRVDAYTDYQVKSINKEDGKKSILDSLSGNRITINDGNNDVLSIKNSNGDNIKFEDIKKDDVVSVFKGLGSVNYTKLVVSDRTETEYLKEMRIDNNKYTFGTEDYVYGISQGSVSNTANISLGKAYKLYIDAFGLVVNYEISDTIYDSIAAVVKLYIQDDGDNTLSARLFTASGNFVSYDFADKWYVDGSLATFDGDAWMYTSAKKGKVKVADMLKKEVFQFELNSKGKIRNIYLPSEQSENTKLSYTMGMLNTQNIINEPNNNKMWYKRNGNYFIPSGSGTSKMNFIVLNANAKVITIPSASVVDDRETFFKVNDGQLTNDYEAAAIGYSFSPDSTTSDLVVIFADGSSDISHSPYYVVTDVNTGLNKDDTAVMMLSLMKNDGSVSTFYGEDTEIIECNPETGNKVNDSVEVNVGDVVKIALNPAGEVNAVAKCYDSKNKTGTMLNPTYWYTGERFVYGSVYDLDNRSVAYVTGSEINPYTDFRNNLHLVGLTAQQAVIVKPGRKNKQIVEYGTIDSVIGYKESQEIYSRMALAGGYGEVSLLVFYLNE